MAISLSAKTQKMIDDRMKCSGFRSVDKLIQHALERVPVTYEVDLDDLDDETRAAIARADAEPGEGMPVDEAFNMLFKEIFSKK